MEIEFPRFHKLHHRCPHQDFRVRSGSVQRADWIDGLFIGQVCISVSFGQEHFPILDHGYRDPRNVVLELLDREHSVEERFQIGGIVQG